MVIVITAENVEQTAATDKEEGLILMRFGVPALAGKRNLSWRRVY